MNREERKAPTVAMNTQRVLGLRRGHGTPVRLAMQFPTGHDNVTYYQQAATSVCLSK